MNLLIEKIRSRASDPATIHDMAEGLSPAPKINPAITLAEIQKLETELGFKFPQLLIDIYTGIGNGGFGPGYGLYTLDEAKKLYLENMKDPSNEWEKGTFPLCTWGCDIHSFVDCLADGFVVYYTNENFGAHDDEDNKVSFEITDKDGNVISTGSGGNIMDVLNGISGSANRPNDNEDDDDEPGLIYHKDTLEEWFSDWTNDIDLWNEMSGDEEEEEEEDNNEPPNDFGRGR